MIQHFYNFHRKQTKILSISTTALFFWNINRQLLLAKIPWYGQFYYNSRGLPKQLQKMIDLVALRTSSIHRRSIRQTYSQFLDNYEGEDDLNLLYNYPANIQIIGEMHRHNTDFGFKQVLQSNEKNVRTCPCCKTQYQNNTEDLHWFKLHLTPSNSQLQSMKKGKIRYKIGTEIISFFTQVKILMLMLILRFILFDLTLLIRAYLLIGKTYSKVQLTKNGHFVDEDYILSEELPFLAKLVVAYYKYDIIAFQLIGLVGIMIAFFIYCHGKHLRYYENIENNMLFENRYAVMIENIPLIPRVGGFSQKKFENMSYQKRIKYYVKNFIRENLLNKIKIHLQNPQTPRDSLTNDEKCFLEYLKTAKLTSISKLEDQIVQDVTVCYESSCLQRLTREKEGIMSHFLNKASQSKAERQAEKHFTIDNLKKLNKFQSKLVTIFDSANTLTDKMPYFLGFAIVTFELTHYRDFIIKQFQKQANIIGLGEGSLIVRAAQKPSVIQWSNFVQRQQQQIKTRVYTNLILVMVLAVTLVLLSYLQIYRIIPMIERWLHFPKKYQQKIKALVITGITSIINYLLSHIIHILATSEKRLSKTGTIVSLLTKNVITQFFNSALIYYLITFVTPASFLFQMKDLKRKIQSLIIFPGIIRILINFLNTKYIFKKVQFEIYSYFNFQIEFNRLYQRPQFDLVNKYTYYIVQILTVSFYAALTPMIVPALLMILPVVYYIDKVVLFNKSSQPPRVSFRVTDWVFFMCQCSLFTFIVGWILFCCEDLWTEGVQITSYFCLLAIVIYLVSRYRKAMNPDKYYSQMQKSMIPHSQCPYFMEKFKDYDPWKCTLKSTRSSIKDESPIKKPKQ